MSNMMIKVMHPTTNSVLDIEVPDDMTLNDVVSELKEKGFVYTGVGTLSAVLKDGEEAFSMDMNKTLEENGVRNNSTIRLLSGTMSGAGPL